MVYEDVCSIQLAEDAIKSQKLNLATQFCKSKAYLDQLSNCHLFSEVLS